MRTSPRQRRRGMAVLAAGLVCIGMGHSLFFAILPPLARELGLSEIQVGAIFTLSAVLWVILSPFWGRKSDVWGRKPVILIGFCGFAVSTGGFGLFLLIGQAELVSASVLFIMLAAVRSIFGFFGAGAAPAAQAYIADRTTRQERTRGVAALGAAFGIGTVIGPGFAALLATLHLTAPFLVLALMSLASALAVLLLLPERRSPRQLAGQKRIELSALDMRVRPFLWLGIIISFTQAAVMQVAAFFVLDVMRLPAAETAQLVALAMMALALATLFVQLFVIPRMNPSVRALLLSGSVITALGTAALLWPMSDALFIIAFLLQGIGYGLLRPGIAAGASLAVSAREQGAAAGLVSSTAAVGIIFVPFIIMPLYLFMPTAPFIAALIMIGVTFFVAQAKAIRGLENAVDGRAHEDRARTRPDQHGGH